MVVWIRFPKNIDQNSNKLNNLSTLSKHKENDYIFVAPCLFNFIQKYVAYLFEFL